MVAPSDRLSRRSNENLLQLWRGRDALKDDEIDPLREQLERRGLTREMDEICDGPPSKDIYGPLPQPPRTYLGITVPLLWIREIWLRIKTRGGPKIEATVESAQRTLFSSSGARVELLYAYQLQGHTYSGRVKRDFVNDIAAADSLAFDHHPGDKLEIRISPVDPSCSYFSSGLDAFDPIVIGLKALFAWATSIVILVVLVTHLLR